MSFVTQFSLFILQQRGVVTQRKTFSKQISLYHFCTNGCTVKKPNRQHLVKYCCSFLLSLSSTAYNKSVKCQHRGNSGIIVGASEMPLSRIERKNDHAPTSFVLCGPPLCIGELEYATTHSWFESIQFLLENTITSKLRLSQRLLGEGKMTRRDG